MIPGLNSQLTPESNSELFHLITFSGIFSLISPVRIKREPKNRLKDVINTHSSGLALDMFGLVHQFGGLTRTCPEPDPKEVAR